MKVTLLKACKLDGNNWKKGDQPSVHPLYATELAAKGYIAAEKDIELKEIHQDGDI